jgi:ATP-dependent protease ClpP protease subunit
MKFNKALIIAAVAMFLTFGLMAFLASQAEGAEASLDWSDKVVIPIIGEVGSSVIGQAGFVEQITNEAEPSKVLHIFINSPGGSVVAGNIFIQSMEVAKARGWKIECAVSNIAASMAMHILTHCDKRVILQNGYLLFHEARVQVGGAMTAREMRRNAQSMDAMTYELEEYMIDELGCSPAFYREHNEGETMWTAATFKQAFPKFNLIIVKDIKVPKDVKQGIFKPLNDKTTTAPPAKTPGSAVGNPAQIPWEVN